MLVNDTWSPAVVLVTRSGAGIGVGVEARPDVGESDPVLEQYEDLLQAQQSTSS